jgi:translin
MSSKKKITTNDLIEKFTGYFDGKDNAREAALKLSREISRGSTAIIRKLHDRGKLDLQALASDLKSVEAKFTELKKVLSDYPKLYHSNMIDNDLQEYAEATIILNLFESNFKTTALPDPDSMGIPYSAYLLGLSDVIGELRRCTLDTMLRKDLKQANVYLDVMEKLFEIIIKLNYPNGVLPLRRKQDVARNLIEKTRSELAITVSEYSLGENISSFKKDLKLYYKNIVRKD